MPSAAPPLSRQSPRTLHVVFREADLPAEGDYFLFPNSPTESPKSRPPLPPLPPVDGRALARNLSHALDTLPEELRFLKAHENNLFYWHYRPLFATLRALKGHLEQGRYERVRVAGTEGGAYSAFTNKGDEGSPLLYRPSVFLGRYIRAATGTIHVEFCPTLGDRLWSAFGFLRNFVLLGGKTALRWLQWVRQRSPRHPLPPHRWTLVSRSLPSVAALEPLADALAPAGQTCAFVLDPGVGYALRNRPIVPSAGRPFVFLDPWLRLTDFLETVEEALGPLPQARGWLESGEIRWNEDWTWVGREFLGAYPDLTLHERALERLLGETPSEGLITTEMVSPQHPIQAAVARRTGHRCIAYQAFSLTPEDVVHCVPGDGMIFPAPALRQKFLRAFPELEPKLVSFGDPHVRPSVVLSDRPLKTVLYFSQPYNESDQDKIVDRLRALTQAVGAHLLIKLHPRDRAPAHWRSKGAEVLEGSSPTAPLWERADLVVSRNSSLLGDALALGVPYVACLLGDYDRQFTPPYLDPTLGVTVHSLEGLDGPVKRAQEYRHQFLERRRAAEGTLFAPFDAHRFRRWLDQVPPQKRRGEFQSISLECSP